VTLFNSGNFFLNKKTKSNKLNKFSERLNKRNKILIYSSDFLRHNEFKNLLLLDSKSYSYFSMKIYKQILLKQGSTTNKTRLIIWNLILKIVFNVNYILIST